MEVRPSRLFFTTLPSGVVEFSCFVSGVGEGVCAWTLSGGVQKVQVEQIVSRAQGRAPLVLTTTLPEGWPDSLLRVESAGAIAEVNVIHPRASAKTFGLPLAGQHLVVGGHRVGEPHRTAMSLPSQQFAWDFIGLSDDRLAVLAGHPEGGLSVADFSCFGEPVRAPASGIVVTAVDGLADSEMSGPEPIEGDPRQAAGNHVVIDHGDGVFSCLAHLQNGSVAVAGGEPVERGTQVGAVGSSGHAFGPHVHLHFMDGPDLVVSSPLPVELDAEGTRFDPQAGQIISE